MERRKTTKQASVPRSANENEAVSLTSAHAGHYALAPLLALSGVPLCKILEYVSIKRAHNNLWFTSTWFYDKEIRTDRKEEWQVKKKRGGGNKPFSSCLSKSVISCCSVGLPWEATKFTKTLSLVSLLYSLASQLELNVITKLLPQLPHYQTPYHDNSTNHSSQTWVQNKEKFPLLRLHFPKNLLRLRNAASLQWGIVK